MLIKDYRSKVLEGTVLVMSGLVPLSADVMRYLMTFTTNHFLSQNVPSSSGLRADYALHLRKSTQYTNTQNSRTEIAIQAQSFGALLQRE